MDQKQKLTIKPKSKGKHNSSPKQEMKPSEHDIKKMAMLMQLVCW